MQWYCRYRKKYKNYNLTFPYSIRIRLLNWQRSIFSISFLVARNMCINLLLDNEFIWFHILLPGLILSLLSFKKKVFSFLIYNSKYDFRWLLDVIRCCNGFSAGRNVEIRRCWKLSMSVSSIFSFYNNLIDEAFLLGLIRC